SEVLSTIRKRVPRRASQSASTSPVGPAPTMRTSVSDVDEEFIVRGHARFRYPICQGVGGFAIALAANCFSLRCQKKSRAHPIKISAKHNPVHNPAAPHPTWKQR